MATKLSLEDALAMVPSLCYFVLHDVDQISGETKFEHILIPDEVRIATAKTIQFLSTVEKPRSIGSPDLKFAAWLLDRSGWKNGTAN